jgi:hypothetical protein
LPITLARSNHFSQQCLSNGCFESAAPPAQHQSGRHRPEHRHDRSPSSGTGVGTLNHGMIRSSFELKIRNFYMTPAIRSQRDGDIRTTSAPFSNRWHDSATFPVTPPSTTAADDDAVERCRRSQSAHVSRHAFRDQSAPQCRHRAHPGALDGPRQQRGYVAAVQILARVSLLRVLEKRRHAQPVDALEWSSTRQAHAYMVDTIRVGRNRTRRRYTW